MAIDIVPLDDAGSAAVKTSKEQLFLASSDEESDLRISTI
jgi:hypothetical protein